MFVLNLTVYCCMLFRYLDYTVVYSLALLLMGIWGAARFLYVGLVAVTIPVRVPGEYLQVSVSATDPGGQPDEL